MCLLIGTFVKAQTEEETIKFLNTKFELYTTPLGGSKMLFKVKTTGYSPNKTIIIELYSDFAMYSDYKLFSTWEFKTNQVTGIKEVTSEDDGSLYLIIVSNKNQFYNKSNDSYRYDNNINIAVNAPNQEVFRIKKAFEHLFKLNGFKDNDNLFKD